MDGRRGDRLAVIAFGCSLACLLLAAGFAVAAFKLPPYHFLHNLVEVAVDAATHWRNEFGIRPTRSLVPASPSRSVRVVSMPDRAAPGLRLVTGFAPRRETEHGAVLLDRAGNEIHFWPIDYAALDPEGPKPQNIFVHGVAAMPDGSLVVNTDGGRVIARIDACGKAIWVTRGRYHHDLALSYDGTIWSARGRQGIVQLDSQTGTPIREIDLVDDIIKAKRLQGVFGIRAKLDEHELTFDDDPFHINDIDILSPGDVNASRYPGFNPGDLMISLRNSNLVAILDGSTLDLKWWSNGPWHRQHDPEMLGSGEIAVFNNDLGSGTSSITILDPLTRAARVAYTGNEQHPFYSAFRGKHHPLPNGSWLIAETEGGRAFEVDGQGVTVWEYNNYFDEESNGYVSSVIYLPVDFYGPALPRCALR